MNDLLLHFLTSVPSHLQHDLQLYFLLFTYLTVFTLFDSLHQDWSSVPPGKPGLVSCSAIFWLVVIHNPVLNNIILIVEPINVTEK